MICSLNFKVLSINTPRYVADFEDSIFSSLNVKDVRGAVLRM